MRPCSHPTSLQGRQVWSMSALPSRTLHGRSPVWTSLTTGPQNFSLPAGADPGRNQMWIRGKVMFFFIYIFKIKLTYWFMDTSLHMLVLISCVVIFVYFPVCPVLCAVVQQGCRCLQKAAGSLSPSLSGTRPCVTLTPPAPPPPQSCLFDDSTPSLSGV